MRPGIVIGGLVCITGLTGDYIAIKLPFIGKGVFVKV